MRSVRHHVVALLVVLSSARAVVLFGRDLPLTVLSPFAFLRHDAILALVFAAVAVGLRRSAPRIVVALFWLVVGFTAFDAVLGRTISTPLTWPVLRAAGGPLADSIALYATADNLAVFLGLIGVGWLALRISSAWHVSIAWIGCACAALVAAVGGLTAGAVETFGLHRHGIVVLATTMWPRAPGAIEASADWRRVREGDARSELTRLRGAASGRNVVLVVLESVAARYLRPYGAVDDPMPNLTRLAGRGVLFENAYAVYPESIKGLVALWHSVHPALDTTPSDYRELSAPALGDLLRASGYRTALFHSGRFGYLGMEHVLEGAGFDVSVDAAGISGEEHSSFGVDDLWTVEVLLDWIDACPEGRRWFVNFLPIAGHHPYDAPEPGPYPATMLFGAYLSAIHYADRALGCLVDGLAERGLSDETVIVVVGDHGQAFGQHEANFGHTFFLYDENVRVPLVIAAPGLTDAASRVCRVASHVDVAPTIVDLLGLPPSELAEGRSLLAGDRAAALLFTDYSLPLLGLREDRWKFILDLDSDRATLFDLRTDPGERRDLAALERDRVESFRARLRGWAASQRARVLGTVQGDF